MSGSERASIESAIAEFQSRLYAQIGRLSIALFASVVAIVGTAVASWSAVKSDVQESKRRLEALEQARKADIARGYAEGDADREWKRAMESNVGRILGILEGRR